MFSIHDEDVAHAAAYQSSDDDSTEVASLSSQPPYDLPAKPLSAVEEQKKRGFYPISWRVIGGGVMMSGKRESLCMSVVFIYNSLPTHSYRRRVPFVSERTM
jgi:hypothetical protein